MNGQERDEWRERVRAHNPVNAVIEQYGVRLRRTGRRNEYVGLCPFHADQKTESLHVYADEGRWWCYGGCVAPDKGGDVFTFVMRMERCDYRRALEILSNGIAPDPTPQLAQGRAAHFRRTERPSAV